MKENAIRCKKCILDSTIPGTILNRETQICQYCERPPAIPAKSDEVNRILTTCRGQQKFDAIFALSGGKDSCYTLYHLKRRYPDLRILAVQFDNGFISDMAVENAIEFCRLADSTYLSLTVDPETLRQAFCRAAESRNGYPLLSRIRASDICNTCIGIVKQKILELALIHEAPLVIFAFSPGQTENPHIRLSMSSIFWFRNLFQKELRSMGVTNSEELLIRKEIIEKAPKDTELILVHPLLIWGYNKRRIEQDCRDLGWKSPNLEDRNSTNCLLNAFAIDNHIKKYGIHPYAFDLAALVRGGHLSREDALHSITSNPSPKLIKYATDRLQIHRIFGEG
jgi:tRNA(Ile)-lysidine synthase TilS/MesJ